MTPTKQTVYLPVNGEQNKVVCDDYLDWMDRITGVLEQEGYFFTSEQLNEYRAKVIREVFEVAAKSKSIIILSTLEKGHIKQHIQTKI